MDGLYLISKAQFHQLATHISLYHEDASPRYRTLAEECIKLAGLDPRRFLYWNIPNMSGFLGGTVPLDVHGGHVLCDEANAGGRATSYGMLRYSYISAAVRAREGGRWRYDFISMNITLGIGVGVGFSTLALGRRRLSWMRRRPVGSIAISFIICIFATIAARQLTRGLGIGVVTAQRSHAKALALLKCKDCYDDVNQYTSQQIEELRRQQLPQQPGMPPPPEQLVRRFERGTKLQVKLLEVDMDEVRAAKRRTNDNLCEVHNGLRENDKYAETALVPILPEDIARAKERKALEAKAENNTE